MQMATSIETDTGEMIVKRVSVPIGLEELMEGLTKEVLLKKPKDIYVFASEYFANLLNLREKGSLKATSGKRVQSLTKQIPANNLGKNLKVKSNSVDTVKNLSRQISVRSSTPQKTLTTKKITLEDKNAERTKTFLNKRKARKNSKDTSSSSTASSKQQSLDDKKEKKTPRSRERSVSKSDKTPRKRSQDGVKQPRKGKTVEEKNKDRRKNVDDEKPCENKEQVDNLKKDVEMIDSKVVDKDKKQKVDGVIGCSMTTEKAVDVVSDEHQKKDLTVFEKGKLDTDLENVDNETDSNNNNNESIDDIISVDEVDSSKINSKTKENLHETILSEKEIRDSEVEITGNSKGEKLKENIAKTVSQDLGKESEKQKIDLEKDFKQKAENKKEDNIGVLDSTKETKTNVENLKQKSEINLSKEKIHDNKEKITADSEEEKLKDNFARSVSQDSDKESENQKINLKEDLKQKPEIRKDDNTGILDSTKEAKTNIEDLKREYEIKKEVKKVISGSTQEATSNVEKIKEKLENKLESNKGVLDSTQEAKVNIKELKHELENKQENNKGILDSTKEAKVSVDLKMEEDKAKLNDVDETNSSPTLNVEKNNLTSKEIKQTSIDIKTKKKNEFENIAKDLAAAVKIQSIWRGFFARKKSKKPNKINEERKDDESNVSKEVAIITETKNKEKLENIESTSKDKKVELPTEVISDPHVIATEDKNKQEDNKSELKSNDSTKEAETEIEERNAKKTNDSHETNSSSTLKIEQDKPTFKKMKQISVDNKTKKNKFENIAEDIAAVIKIQSIWRGFLARKKSKKSNNINKESNETESKVSKEIAPENKEKESVKVEENTSKNKNVELLAKATSDHVIDAEDKNKQENTKSEVKADDSKENAKSDINSKMEEHKINKKTSNSNETSSSLHLHVEEEKRNRSLSDSQVIGTEDKKHQEEMKPELKADNNTEHLAKSVSKVENIEDDNTKPIVDHKEDNNRQQNINNNSQAKASVLDKFENADGVIKSDKVQKEDENEELRNNKIKAKSEDTKEEENGSKVNVENRNLKTIEDPSREIEKTKKDKQPQVENTTNNKLKDLNNSEENNENKEKSDKENVKNHLTKKESSDNIKETIASSKNVVAEKKSADNLNITKDEANNNQLNKESVDSDSKSNIKEKIPAPKDNTSDMSKENKADKDNISNKNKSKEDIKIKNKKSKSLSHDNLKPKDEKRVQNPKRIKSVDLMNKNQLEKTKSKTSSTTQDVITRNKDFGKDVRKKRSTSVEVVKDKNLNKSAQQLSFDASKLREELKQVNDMSKMTTFKASYNPYKLRQEIKQASIDDKIEKKNEFENIAKDIAAAIKIQSIWRGFLARKKSKTNGEVAKNKTNQEKEKNIKTIESLTENKYVEPVGKTRTDQNQSKSEKKNELEEIAKNIAAAIKIQSIWRGFLVRKKSRKSGKEVENKAKEVSVATNEDGKKKDGSKRTDDKNVDLNTNAKIDQKQILPENELEKRNELQKIANDIAAAIKIQSIWRGFLIRKKIKKQNKFDESVVKEVETNKEKEENAKTEKSIPEDKKIELIQSQLSNKVEIKNNSNIKKEKSNKNIPETHTELNKKKEGKSENDLQDTQLEKVEEESVEKNVNQENKEQNKNVVKDSDMKIEIAESQTKRNDEIENKHVKNTEVKTDAKTNKAEDLKHEKNKKPTKDNKDKKDVSLKFNKGKEEKEKTFDKEKAPDRNTNSNVESSTHQINENKQENDAVSATTKSHTKKQVEKKKTANNMTTVEKDINKETKITEKVNEQKKIKSQEQLNKEVLPAKSIKENLGKLSQKENTDGVEKIIEKKDEPKKKESEDLKSQEFTEEENQEIMSAKPVTLEDQKSENILASTEKHKEKENKNEFITSLEQNKLKEATKDFKETKNKIKEHQSQNDDAVISSVISEKEVSSKVVVDEKNNKTRVITDEKKIEKQMLSENISTTKSTEKTVTEEDSLTSAAIKNITNKTVKNLTDAFLTTDPSKESQKDNHFKSTTNEKFDTNVSSNKIDESSNEKKGNDENGKDKAATVSVSKNKEITSDTIEKSQVKPVQSSDKIIAKDKIIEEAIIDKNSKDVNNKNTEDDSTHDKLETETKVEDKTSLNKDKNKQTLKSPDKNNKESKSDLLPKKSEKQEFTESDSKETKTITDQDKSLDNKDITDKSNNNANNLNNINLTESTKISTERPELPSKEYTSNKFEETSKTMKPKIEPLTKENKQLDHRKKELSMANAVLKIQTIWRGFKVRKQFEHEKLFGTSIKPVTKTKEALEAKKIDKSKAVSKIQAVWRGYKVRKGIRDMNNKLSEQQQPEECDELHQHRRLTDDDIFKAACKIQAGVRGYMVRKKRSTKLTPLNSITEEEPSDEKLSDKQVLEALNQLKEIPRESPVKYQKDQSSTSLNKTELDSNLEKSEVSINDTTGSEISKNNLTKSEEDNKTTESEVKFITEELNSSTTNKLSNLNSAPLIDDSISKSFINKETDPIPRQEPGYEDAPTRPVTSNKIEKAENDKDNKQSSETQSDTLNKKSNKEESAKVIDDRDTKQVVLSEEGQNNLDLHKQKKEENNDASLKKLGSDNSTQLKKATLGENNRNASKGKSKSLDSEKTNSAEIGDEIVKMNKFILENEIASYNKQLQEMAAKNYEELIDIRPGKTELSTDSKIVQKFKDDESVNNKLNKTVLETEINKSTKSLQTKVESSVEPDKKDISTETKIEETHKTENKSETGREILRVHIPLRELSDIKEEDVDDKSPISNKKLPPVQERTSHTVETGNTQKSSGTTINLVHSSEFHDTITVPIPITPPTRTSSGGSETTGQASPQGLVNTGELHDNIAPLSVQLNEAPPAGAEILTSHVSKSINGGQDPAQASNKDASTCEAQPDKTTPSSDSMETEKRNNASIQKKNMEAEAATKIQAGFRGYQVRKQLKNKISAPGDISNQRRSARRKSSGRLTDSGRITQNKTKQPSDVEEKSAVKIQAGVRGFLVRRRQKKQNQGKESS